MPESSLCRPLGRLGALNAGRGMLAPSGKGPRAVTGPELQGLGGRDHPFHQQSEAPSQLRHLLTQGADLSEENTEARPQGTIRAPLRYHQGEDGESWGVR